MKTAAIPSDSVDSSLTKEIVLVAAADAIIVAIIIIVVVELAKRMIIHF